MDQSNSCGERARTATPATPSPAAADDAPPPRTSPTRSPPFRNTCAARSPTYPSLTAHQTSPADRCERPPAAAATREASSGGWKADAHAMAYRAANAR